MKSVISLRLFGLLLVVAVLVIAAVTWMSRASLGPTDHGAIETIDGVAYPNRDGVTVVTETLAHADVYLDGSVLGRDAVLTIDFDPLALERLEVGIRDNDFWLSYPPILVFDRDIAHDVGRQQTTVRIPLTDKLAAADGSVDVMFFATPPSGAPELTAREQDTTTWLLHGFTVDVLPAAWSLTDVGTWWQLGDFVLSALERERPL